MGSRVVACFAEADRIGGIVAKMRLAARTGVTSAAAPQIEDDEQLLARFQSALERLRAEFSTKGERDRAEVAAGYAHATVLRGYLDAYGDLMSQRQLLLGRVDETIQRVDETSARLLACERVSVWMLDPARTKITCLDLYEREPRRHSKGIELRAADYPPYFEAMQRERTIAAHDAQRDSRTSCFAESYLRPLGIGAMLDVPVWANSHMIGVICHEHVGGPRTWNADEEQFAYLISNFVGLAFERGSPPG
jgi:GAF domain-containing protein